MGTEIDRNALSFFYVICISLLFGIVLSLRVTSTTSWATDQLEEELDTWRKGRRRRMKKGR